MLRCRSAALSFERLSHRRASVAAPIIRRRHVLAACDPNKQKKFVGSCLIDIAGSILGTSSWNQLRVKGEKESIDEAVIDITAAKTQSVERKQHMKSRAICLSFLFLLKPFFFFFFFFSLQCPFTNKDHKKTDESPLL